MIACFSKNDRAYRLFDELHRIDSEFVNLGIVKASRRALRLGAASSVQPSIRQLRADMTFSPALAREMELKGSELMRANPGARAILYWGATNQPACMEEYPLPYFVVSDGPFDPNDESYPIEWKPARWRNDYFQRQRRVYGNAVHVFTLSEWAKQKLIRVHGIPEDRVTRMGWGPMHSVDAPNFELKGKPYFLSLGNEWHRKGMDIVAAAGAAFHAICRDAVTVIGGEPAGMSLPRRSEGVSLIPQSLPGVVAQTLIANARALIVASRFDASPHIIYEALQAGTPVIGSDSCGIPEAISAPRGGRIFRNGDIDALVAAMSEIWNQDIGRQRRDAYSVHLESGGWTSCAELVYEQMRKVFPLEMAIS